MYNKQRKRKSFIIVAIILILVLEACAVVVGLAYNFYLRTVTDINLETQRFFDENSVQIVSNVTTSIKSEVNLLIERADFLKQDNTLMTELAGSYVSNESMSSLVNTTNKEGVFGIALTMGPNAGQCYFADGYSESVTNQAFYSSGLNRLSALSPPVKFASYAEKCMVFSSPILYGTEVRGIVLYAVPESGFRKTVLKDSFDGEGYSMLITSNGTPVVKSDHRYSAAEYGNLFEYLAANATMEVNYSLEDVRGDCVIGNTGSFRYSLDDDRLYALDRYMNYAPVFSNETEPIYVGCDWYCVTIVAQENAAASMQEFIVKLGWICLAVSVLLSALIIAIFIIRINVSAKLESMAYVDEVTEGSNQNEMMKDYEKLLRYIKRKQSYVFVCLNVNSFKLINDAYERSGGDKVLKAIYDTIRDSLKKRECVARINSDHYNFLIKCPSQEAVLERLKVIGGSINEPRLKKKIGINPNYHISLTIGLTILEKGTKQHFDRVQDKAYLALSNATASLDSNITYMFYDEALHNKIKQEKELDNRKETALKNHEFEVFLQPKYEPQENTLAGAEALMRWHSKDTDEYIRPDLFVPIFEESGFIVQLDLFVFESVCKQLRLWLDKGKNCVPVSVNLSRKNFENADFLQDYITIKERYSVPDFLIEIELTESFFADNLEQISKIVEDLKAAGFSTSIDDFGSGYSSLNMLKKVNVDTIKLDKEFFSNWSNNAKEKTLISGLVAIAKKLSLKVVAEGVETPDQLEFLKRIQCELIQGYIFSKAIPLSEFETLAFGEGEKKRKFSFGKSDK